MDPFQQTTKISDFQPSDDNLLKDSAAGPPKGPISCDNCKTSNTPLWRRGPQKTYLCNACGLYYKIHGSHRSLARRNNAKKVSVPKNKMRGPSAHIGMVPPFFQPTMFNYNPAPFMTMSTKKYQIGEVVIVMGGCSPEKPYDSCAFIRAINNTAIQVTWLNLKPNAAGKQTNYHASDFDIGFSDPRFYPITAISRSLNINMMTNFSMQLNQKQPPPQPVTIKAESRLNTDNGPEKAGTSNLYNFELDPIGQSFNNQSPSSEFCGTPSAPKNMDEIFISPSSSNSLDTIPPLHFDMDKLTESSPFAIQSIDKQSPGYDFSSLLQDDNVWSEDGGLFSLPESSIRL